MPPEAGRRILVIGSPTWTSVALAREAIAHVEQIYRGPYTLVCDDSEGAARYAAAAAVTAGWTVEKHPLDATKCGPECPPEPTEFGMAGHRRPGGPTGSYCPSAKGRLIDELADTGIDQVIVLNHGRRKDSARRDGTKSLRLRGIGVWEYTQPSARRG